MPTPEIDKRSRTFGAEGSAKVRDKMPERGIEHLFGSVTRTRLLRTFLNSSEKSFFVRELSRTIATQLNAVRRELENLESFDLVRSEGIGQKKFYKLNHENIIFPELKALVLKSQLLLENGIAKRIDALGPIQLLLLTGKFVGRTDAPADMLLVGRVNREDLRDVIHALQIDFGYEINYTVMTSKEYAYRLEVGDKFLYSILESKRIMLIDRMPNNS